MMCSFDGGAAENCSLSLIVDFNRFGTDHHTVVLTATDVFGQTASVSLSFCLTEPSKLTFSGEV